MKWLSFLAGILKNYVYYSKSSGRWDDGSTYAGYLHLFDVYCAVNYPNARDLTQEMVDSWCNKRDTETNNSCRSRIYPIVTFLKYAISRNLLDVQLPVIPRKTPRTYIPHPFTREELERFFDACDNLEIRFQPELETKITKISLPVFYRLLLSSGIRTTEARLMKKGDVNLDNGIIDVKKSKGHDQHYIVLHESMLELMRKYDNTISRLCPERTYFFPTGNNSYQSRVWVSKFFRKIWRSCNEGRATPYQLRHFYAKENIDSWINEDMNTQIKLTYLGKAMGHRLLESTKYYYSITPGLAEVIQNLTEDTFNDIIPDIKYE